MKRTQELMVITKLKIDGYVDRNWALQNYCSRLGAIICDLKKDGWEFDPKYVRENGGRNFYYYVLKSPLKIQSYKVEGLGEIKVYA